LCTGTPNSSIEDYLEALEGLKKMYMSNGVHIYYLAVQSSAQRIFFG